MIRNIVVINIIEILERFAYYGVRAILLIFLTKYVQWDRMHAVEVYGTFTLLVYFASVVGGILSDATRNPALIALIGNSITSVGILVLAFVNSDMMIYGALFCIAIGSGAYKPAIVCTLYRVSITHKRRFDLIFSIFYFAINIGAFLAPLVVGGLGDTGNPADFRTGFLAAGLASIIVTILLAVSYNNFKSNDLVYYNQTFKLSPVNGGQIAVMFIVSMVFWIGYESLGMWSDTGSNYLAQIFPAIGLILLSLILIPLSLFDRFRGAWKIAIGLFLLAICLLLGPGYYLPVGMIGIGAAEILVAPILMSQIMQNSSPRFNGTMIAGFMMVTLITNKLAGIVSSADFSSVPAILLSLGMFCLLFAGAVVLLDYFRKKEDQSTPPQLY